MSKDKLFLENYQNDKKLKRQELIKKIEDITKRKLIVYTANFGNPASSIRQEDIPIMEDLLRTVSASGNQNVDLMLHSPGGELNPTEKMLLMIRNHFKNFRVIVPNSAKSAATMLALGSDEIVMGHLSEIGPIDPQILKSMPNGRFMYISAYALTNSMDIIKRKIKKKEPYELFMPILSNIEPEMLDYCEKIISESKDIVKKWLTSYMLKGSQKKAEKIVEALSSTKIFKTHGKLISAEDAKKLGLKIRILSDDEILWKLIWELYYRSEIFLKESPNLAKLFETSESSINFNLSIQQIVLQN